MSSIEAIVRVLHFLLCEQQNGQTHNTMQNRTDLEENNNHYTEATSRGLYITEKELKVIIEDAVKTAVEQVSDKRPKQEDISKISFWQKLLFVVNVILFPFHIGKKFKMIERVHDGFLTMVISILMMFIGVLMWGGSIYSCYKCIAEGHWSWSFFPVVPLMFGSLAILSSKSFGKETDSEKIYAYSASIIALLSCIASWIVIFNKLY